LGLNEIEPLVELAAGGDALATEQLFAGCRDRLRQVVAVRMHADLAGRCDPSDVVQDAMVDAQRRWPDYLARRPLPFFLWLRKIALDRLTDYGRRHLYADRRSVYREQALGLSDDSVAGLGRQLADSAADPQRQVASEEIQERCRAGLEQLPAEERELLVMRYSEEMEVQEIAALMGIGEGAVKWRVCVALEKLQRLMAGRKPPK
jgi:RNA polymerase sigma-70 factor, ECF subfamily